MMRKSDDKNLNVVFFEPYFNRMIYELEETRKFCQKMNEEITALKLTMASIENVLSVKNNVLVQRVEVEPTFRDISNASAIYETNNVVKQESFPSGCANAEVVNGDIVLNVVDEQYEQYAVFFICKGEGETMVEFNSKSVKYAITNAEVQLFPYFDVEYEGGNASDVKTIENGKAVWKNGKWVLKQKPKIRII